jgi:hypothetical protein
VPAGFEYSPRVSVLGVYDSISLEMEGTKE